MSKRIEIEIFMDRGAASAEARAFTQEQKKLAKDILADEQAKEQASAEAARRGSAEKVRMTVAEKQAAVQAGREKLMAEVQAATQAIAEGKRARDAKGRFVAEDVGAVRA